MRLTLFTDGGARGNPGPAAIGVVVKDDAGQFLHEHAEYIGETTNNDAEYKAFLTSVEWLLASPLLAQVESLTWNLDSMLVVEQLQRHWKIKEPHLKTLAEAIWQKLAQLTVPYSIKHVPRAQNKEADALVNQALDALQ